MSRNLIVMQEGRYRIEENVNYDPGKGNLFLIQDREIWTPTAHLPSHCVGGVDQLYDDTYEACICKPEDEDGSDATLVYKGNSRQEAIDALWENRWNAV